MQADGNQSIRRRALSGISRPLQIIAVVVFVAIVAVTVSRLLETRTGIIADTEKQMARLDMVFAEQTGRAMETVDLIVRSVIEWMPNARGLSRGAFEDEVRHRIEGVRQLAEVAVLDAAGAVLYDTRPGAAAAASPVAAEILESYRGTPSS